MRHRSAYLLLVCMLTAGALLFRLPNLGNRPFHGDEAVHAFKFLDLWKKGDYRYDHNEFHGPTIYFAALPSVVLQGRKTFAATREADYRLPIAVCGALIVLMMAPLSDGLGRRAVFAAAILAAISPAFVFYSRYYIQEIPLVLFTAAMLACGWRYTRHQHRFWLLLAGASAGLMIASKETAVLTFAAMCAAFLLVPAWSHLVDERRLPVSKTWRRGDVAMAAGVMIFVAALLITGLFRHPAGIIDYFRSYTPWLHRANTGSLHKYPWNYYLGILLWTQRERSVIYSELLILALALVGLIAALLPKRRSSYRGSSSLGRFIGFYTVLLTLVYSVIPYKTPWCLLSFLHGMILLAGLGAIALIDLARPFLLKAAVSILLAAGAAQLGYQAYRASFVDVTDPRNPYIYSQPVPDIANFGERMHEIAQYTPQGGRLLTKVIWKDDYHWPVAWYLRDYANVRQLAGFYHDASDPDADLVISSVEYEDDLTKRLDKTHILTKTYGVRSGVFAQVWVRQEIWSTYLKNRPKPKDDE